MLRQMSFIFEDNFKILFYNFYKFHFIEFKRDLHMSELHKNF